MIRFAGKDSAGIVYVSSSLSSSLFFYIYVYFSFFRYYATLRNPSGFDCGLFSWV